MAGGPAVLKFSRGLPPSKQFGERLRLLVIDGQDKGTCFSLIGDLVFIGREGCQINLNDSNISKKHAELGWRGEFYSVRDLGSSNGIVLNGAKVSESPLKPGDILLIGLSVLEVYPTGQGRRNDRPLLPSNQKRAILPSSGVGGEKNGSASSTPLSPEEIKKKRESDKKRLIIYVALFFLAFILYFSEGDGTTNRESKRLPKGEEEVAPKPKTKQVSLRKIERLKIQMEKSESSIEQNQKKIKNLRKEIEKSQKEIEDALAGYVPNYQADTPQRKDAEIFFRNGVREMQNKNFRRAFTAFETALTVDSSHDLAKIYLKSAKKEMMAELLETSAAGLRSKKALRYKEARMHYSNIIRYLEGESGTSDYMENESNKELKKLLEEAKQAIEELDKEENRLK
jgi:pSer/pThr/pTyr-binding forkhead associated (FHA) protein